MKTVRKIAEPKPSIYNRLDGVRMSESDRDIAKAHLRLTEGLLDLAWLAGAHIRGAILRISGASAKAGAPAVRATNV